MNKKDIFLVLAAAGAMIAYMYATDNYPQVRTLTQK